MRILQTITQSAALMVVALFTGCSKSESPATPHVTIRADRGTNVTMVTNSGYTLMIGKIITNDSTKPK